MKAVVASVATLMGVMATAYGSVWFLDSRYASAEGFKDLNWSLLKENIRDIRRELRDEPDNDGLREDLERHLDLLCRDNPTDRECAERA